MSYRVGQFHRQMDEMHPPKMLLDYEQMHRHLWRPLNRLEAQQLIPDPEWQYPAT